MVYLRLPRNDLSVCVMVIVLSCIECVADVDHEVAVLDAAIALLGHGVGEADFVGDAGTELVVEHNLGAEAQAEVKAVHLSFAAEELVHGRQPFFNNYTI